MHPYYYGSRVLGGAAAGFPFWTIAGGILMLALLALAVTAVVVLIRSSRRGSPRGERDERDESLTILKARYARGEISKEQYEEMRRTLSV